MLGRTAGAVLVGVHARLVDVEVHLGGGLPNISAVGLPNSSVREGIDRIRAALAHSGFRLPQRRVTVNLAPADVRKEGAALDLPIATAILAADGRLGESPSSDVVLAGELALDGAVRSVRGFLRSPSPRARQGEPGCSCHGRTSRKPGWLPGFGYGPRRPSPTRLRSSAIPLEPPTRWKSQRRSLKEGSRSATT